MGFFESCWEALLQVAALLPYGTTTTTYENSLNQQQPILGSSHPSWGWLDGPPPQQQAAAPISISSSSPPASSSIPDYAPGGKGFQCVYPDARWKSCHTPTSRGCWLQDTEAADAFEAYSRVDMHTDYENVEAVPQGITREYWLEVNGDFTLSADGFEKTSGKVFNQTFPGPLIEACWGDELVIHVRNNDAANGTTIHWHGIRQLNTMQMDGVNGVTQCPIAKGDTFTYRFKALQYGHTWYHSHYSLQYPDGLVGPLVIHGPSSSDWDIDLGPVLIQDYVHDSAFVRYDQEINPAPGSFARADSVVVNGQGHDPVTGTGSYFETRFTPGKKHVLRLINGAAGTAFVFSIDNHNLTVIESDFVPIEPYTTTSLNIGIGQRYMVVVEADQAPGNYWMRTHPATGCNGFNASLPCNGIFNDTCEVFSVTTGIVRYDDTTSSSSTAAADPSSEAWAYGRACADEPLDRLRPVVPWVIDRHPQNDVTEHRFAAAHQDGASANATGGYAHWMLTPDFLWLDFANPSILNIDNRTYDWTSNYHIVEDDYDSGYVFMVIEASSNTSLTLPDNVTVIQVSHPLHWHGMDVVLLAQSNTTFDPASSYQDFRFDNPPRRDVVLLPAGGYIAIAFKPDNPGVWLLHCHIAWHASAGLGLQILERQGEIVKSLGGPGALAETERVCRNWRRYNAQHPVDQEDSGI